jgi:hypothetical protein
MELHTLHPLLLGLGSLLGLIPKVLHLLGSKHPRLQLLILAQVQLESSPHLREHLEGVHLEELLIQHTHTILQLLGLLWWESLYVDVQALHCQHALGVLLELLYLEDTAVSILRDFPLYAHCLGLEAGTKCSLQLYYGLRIIRSGGTPWHWEVVLDSIQ